MIVLFFFFLPFLFRNACRVCNATAEQVDDDIQHQTSRVQITANRLRDILSTAFATPSDSNCSWHISKDVASIGDGDGPDGEFQLTLVNTTGHATVEWKFQLKRDNDFAVRKELTHPLILVVGEMQSRLRNLMSEINKKDEEIAAHVQQGSAVSVMTQPFETYDKFALSLPRAGASDSGESSKRFAFNFNGRPMDAFQEGSDLAQLYPFAVERAAADAAAARAAMSAGGRGGRNERGGNGGGAAASSRGHEDDDEETMPVPGADASADNADQNSGSLLRQNSAGRAAAGAGAPAGSTAALPALSEQDKLAKQKAVEAERLANQKLANAAGTAKNDKKRKRRQGKRNI